MKNRYLLLMGLILSLAFNCVIAQDLKIEGKLIDKTTNDPVFGAIIMHSGKALAFSDNTGYFFLTLSKYTPKDSISISHLTYKDRAISLSNLKSDTNLIFITEKIVPIDEIRVKPIIVENIFKEIKKQFQHSYPRLPYWAEADYSQLISYKGQACSYFECYGNMLLIGKKEKNPFINPFCIPSEVRRTKENPILAKVVLYPNNETQRLQVSGLYMNLVLTEYRFFEVCHPLSPNMVNNFDFHLDSICNYNNTSCYLFSFKQKSRIVCASWPIHAMKGQMWVDTNSFNLLKIIGVFNRGNAASNQINVEYKCLENMICPQNISIHQIQNKYLSKLLFQKIFVESTINFSKIDLTERDYTRKYNYEIECYLSGFKYNKLFWVEHPIKDSYLKTKVQEIAGENSLDEEFEKGTSGKVFEDSERFDSCFKKSSDVTIDILNQDLKMN